MELALPASALPALPADLREVLPVYAVTPFTMLDFPERTACIVWFSGCNMRCPYCHNPQIVKGQGRGKIADVMDFLRRRRGRLDGIVLSGGEASTWPGLPGFIREARSLGYAIKLDTNGLRPDRIRSFLNDGLLDFIALDYKAPAEKFRRITGTEKFDLFKQTLDLLCTQKRVPFEVRTTVHTALLNEDDVSALTEDLERRGFRGTHAIQNFVSSDDRPTLAPLPAQMRLLDVKKLYRPPGITLQFRNFPTP